MADDDIVANVTLAGADEFAASFDKAGEAGVRNLSAIDAAAKQTAPSLAAVEAMAKKLGVSSAEAQRLIEANGGALKGLGEGAKGTAVHLQQFEEDVGRAGAGARSASIDFRAMSGTLRALGRATQIPGLAQLGGQFRVLGRLGAVAIPGLLIAGLEQLASSAASAASKVGDLAVKNEQSSAEFQRVAQFGAAAGIGVDKMAEAISGVNKLFQESAENAKKNSEKIAQLKDTQRQLEQQATQLAQRYRDLEQAGVKAWEKQTEAAANFAKGQRSIDDDFAQLARDRAKFNGVEETADEKRARAKEDLDKRELALIEKQSEAIEKRRQEERNLHQEEVKRQEQQAALIDQEAENAKKQRETKKALSEAASEASRSQNVIDRLGLSALDANGKVRKFNEEGLKDLAEAFSRLPDGADKTRAAADLVAAGLDRALLPALKRGRKGVEDFIEEGKKIAPGFTEAQEAIGDKFVEAEGKFTLALKNLKDQAGIEIAPGFTKFFEDMGERIKNAIPFVQEISKALGFLIGLSGKLTLQPFPIIAAIQLIKGAIKELNLGWATIPKIAKFWFELLKSVVTTVWEFIKDAFNEGVAFLKSIKFGDLLAEAWRLLKVGVSLAWDFIKDKFNEGIKFLKSIKVGDVLQFLWDLAKQGVSALWDFIKQKFNDGIQFLKSIRVGDVLQFLWDLIKQGAQALWDFLVQKFKDGVTELQKLIPNDPLQVIWDLIKKGASDLWDFLVQKFKDGADAAWQWVKDKANDALTWVNQKIDESLGKLKDLWNQVKQVASAFASLFGGGGAASKTPSTQDLISGLPGLAGGGQVKGKGTSTSDSILAFLSNDEWVMRAAAVKKYGQGFMHAINTLQLPKLSLGGLADGMQVRRSSSSLIPAFAGGGPVSAGRGRDLVLKIEGESFNLRTRDDATAEQITRFAIRKSTRSAGRKPSAWG